MPSQDYQSLQKLLNMGIGGYHQRQSKATLSFALRSQHRQLSRTFQNRDITCLVPWKTEPPHAVHINSSCPPDYGVGGRVQLVQREFLEVRDVGSMPDIPA